MFFWRFLGKTQNENEFIHEENFNLFTLFSLFYQISRYKKKER